MDKSFTQEDINKNMKRLEKCFPHLTKFPHRRPSGEKTINLIRNSYDILAYPQHPNWTYCIPVYPNVEINGKIVDIGFHMNDDWIKEGKLKLIHCISANIVYSNEEQDYGSGPINVSSKFNKALAIGLYQRLEIISREQLGHLILDFNGFLMNFFKSDLDGFDLQDFVNANTKSK